jgi:hypothetical protein
MPVNISSASFSVLTGFARGPSPPVDESLYIALSPLPAPRFGNIQPSEFLLARRTLVVTNVQPFPWNRLTVDGQVVPLEATIASGQIPRLQEVHFKALSVVLEPGQHTLEYRFAPDRIWRALQVVSWFTLFSGLLAAARMRCPSTSLHRFRGDRVITPARRKMCRRQASDQTPQQKNYL